MRNRLLAAAALSLFLDACSSRPREFTPTLGLVSADPAKFEASYANCRQLLVAGKLDSSGRLASGGPALPPAARLRRGAQRRRPAPGCTAEWR